MKEKFDIIIVGSGIVGLASALQILRNKPNLSLLILDKESESAKHQSMRNSGVIHSGIYYKKGSKKLKNCINGYKLLTDYCQKNEVKYEICGKLILANNIYEDEQLNLLYLRGERNGLKNLKILSSNESKEIEPNSKCTSALYVPQTGIINYKELADSYIKNILLLGGTILYKKEVINIRKNKTSPHNEVICKDQSFIGKSIIICAGLQSDRLCMKTKPNIDMRIIPFKGEYFLVKKEAQHLIKNLIYPVANPDFPFLGVHFTRLISGEIECGPNAVLSFSREGYKKYSFNFGDTLDTLTWPGFIKLCLKYYKEGFNEYWRSIFKDAFVLELQKLVPEIKSSDIYTASSGIRAQACNLSGFLLDDFVIFREENITHVCNAPSPAATSSLSIGLDIAKQTINNI